MYQLAHTNILSSVTVMHMLGKSIGWTLLYLAEFLNENGASDFIRLDKELFLRKYSYIVCIIDCSKYCLKTDFLVA